MRAGLPSPLVPSPALSKASTQGEMLSGQKGQGPEALGPKLIPGVPTCASYRAPTPVRPSQNLAVFQASPFLFFPEHQNQHRVVTLHSTGSTGNGLFLLETFLTLTVNLYYLSASCKQEPLAAPSSSFCLPDGEIWVIPLPLLCLRIDSTKMEIPVPVPSRPSTEGAVS